MYHPDASSLERFWEHPSINNFAAMMDLCLICGVVVLLACGLIALAYKARNK